MRLTLDTNICSYILRRHPAAMVERFAGLAHGQVWLSAIVAAELRFGAAKLASARFSASVEAWLAGFDVRPWPTDATHHYAALRAALEKAGKPIGGMDMMIAAHSLPAGAILVTNNLKHYKRIEAPLILENWNESP